MSNEERSDAEKTQSLAGDQLVNQQARGKELAIALRRKESELLEQTARYEETSFQLRQREKELTNNVKALADILSRQQSILQRAAQAEDELAAIKMSSSWKITKPLRWVSAALRRFTNGKYLNTSVGEEEPMVGSDSGANASNAAPALLDRAGRLNIKVAIIAWDVSHANFARAHMLAEALATRFEVMLLGPRFGGVENDAAHTLEPDRALPVISFPGRPFPGFNTCAESLICELDCDVLLACGLRMSSLHLALLAKQKLNRPLIVDVEDDTALSSTGSISLTFADLLKSDPQDLNDPLSEPWTRFAQSLLPAADAILVPNAAAQRQLGQDRSHVLDGRDPGDLSRDLEAVILSTLQNPAPLPRETLAYRHVLNETLHADAPSAPHSMRINAKGRYDMVFFWRQPDAGVYGRRAEMLAKYFAKLQDVRQVLFIDAPLSHHELLRRLNSSGLNEHRAIYEEFTARRLHLSDKDNLSFRSFLYSSLVRDEFACWSYPGSDGFMSWLERQFEELGIDTGRAIFWVFPINGTFNEAVRLFKPKITVADIVDDLRAQPGISQSERAEREQAYRDIMSDSDLVVTNCIPIQQSLQSDSCPIRVLPNACETEPPAAEGDGRLRRILDIVHPRLGYVGNLESKVDVALLWTIATQRPDWQLVLVGSTHSRAEILDLRALPNVHFMGVVKYEECRLWIRQFDVALVPHLETPLTRSMNPLKVFTYLAEGVPVVSTAVSNIDELRQFVYVAETKDDFIHGIEQVLSGQVTMDKDKLSAALAENAWPRRVEKAMTWINELSEATEGLT